MKSIPPGNFRTVDDPERLPYIVAYRVKDDTVEVLRIWHPSQEGRY